MRRRKDETAKGLFSISVGDHGYRVTAREKERGGIVILDADRHRVLESTGLRVRDEGGRIDAKLRHRIEDIAKDRSARLRTEKASERRLNQLRRAVEPARLTVADGIALYHDPDKGGMPASKSARVHMRASKEFWINELGADTPWNQVTPSDISAAAMKLRALGKVQTADKRVKNLRTVCRWLVNQKDIEGLKDPTRNFDFKKLWENYEEKQPPFTMEESIKLMAVRHQVDPRFALMFVMEDDSGARSAALRRWKRSMLDERLDAPPTPLEAPYGWVNFPGMKGQGRALTLLTLRQRIEIVRAIWMRWNGLRWVPGFLSELERRYQAHGEDYFMIPGGRMPRDRIMRISTEVSDGTPLNWLGEAEVAAGIKHVERRGLHGVRRCWSNYTYNETDLDTLTDAGGWSDSETPGKIYLTKVKHGRLARSREAQERKSQ